MQSKLQKNAKITLSILFCFIGVFLLSLTYLQSMKNKVFDNENRKLIEQTIIVNDIIQTIEVDEQVTTKLPVNYDAKGRYDYMILPDL